MQASGALSDFAQNQFDYLQSAFGFVGPLLALKPYRLCAARTNEGEVFAVEAGR